MAKSSVSKLVPKVPTLPSVPGTGRRAAYSASTQRALVDVAEVLFTDHGYANTSLDAIVAGAQVTKGALYHHFSGKQALFEAVFERVEAESSKSIQKAIKKEHCCNGTVLKDEESGQEVLQFQGDQRDAVKTFLIKEEISDKESIKVHGF